LARKILLADDSVTAQNMGRKILADAGYEVITVNNGSAALKKITEHKPDLIVLDVYMPGYSGLEVCQRLKDAQDTSRIPVLLTVGKLEPFKPEEARRVRAEGFIVKPFEASELLAALAKLEDKIVPRAEPSKPGRFARANAAIDEGRHDKSAGSEEDSGWKSRIGFPSKKKKPAEEEEADDSAIYNAVNKDLRTVIERKPAPSRQDPPAHEARPDEARVDLGALAPEGLPKDVTPEEIAALAAAAAQVKGKFTDSVAETAPQQTMAAAVEVASSDAKADEKSELKVETSAVSASFPPAPATFAEQKSEGRREAFEEKSEPAAALSTPDVAASPAALGTEPARSLDTTSPTSLASRHTVEQPADEPVTMAIAAGAQFAGAASRWTAVPVALASDEAAISLESEMQKAYAAYAAPDLAPAAFVSPSPEIPPVAVEPVAAIEAISPVDSVTPELVAPVQTPTAPEPQTESTSPTMAAMATSASEAIATAVREFEKVAASFFESKPPAPAEPEPTPAQSAETPALQASDVPPATEAKPEESAVAQAVAWTREPVAAEPAEPEVAKPAPVEQPSAEQTLEQEIEQTYQELKVDEPKLDDAKLDESKHESQPDEPAPTVAVTASVVEEAAASTAQTPEPPLPIILSEASVSETSTSQVSETSETVAATESAPAAAKDSGKESESADTTAAAWASWRRIRESGDSKDAVPPPQSQPAAEEASVPQETAAMAVAAGAEKAPIDVPPAAEDSGEIASIVDSVLADMRPRIVEEISRKMRKK
jgi:two-component system chemotaxis response regulator CheY